MPAEVSWQRESRVIYIRAWGDLTLDEMRESSATQEQYVRQGDPPVHSIIDITDLNDPGVRNLVQFRSAIMDPNTPGVGWIVIVGSNRIIHFMGSVAAQLSGVNLRLVSTVEEAVQTLARVDSTLTV